MTEEIFNVFRGTIWWIFVLFVGVLGVFNGPRKDTSYTFLLEPSGKSNGTK